MSGGPYETENSSIFYRNLYSGETDLVCRLFDCLLRQSLCFVDPLLPPGRQPPSASPPKGTAWRLRAQAQLGTRLPLNLLLALVTSGFLWFSLIFFNLHCSTFFSLVTILRQIALLVHNRWWFIRAKLRLAVHIDEINSTTRLRIISLLAWQSLGV